MNFINRILNFFLAPADQRVDNQLQDAMARVARFDAEFYYHERMSNFYEGRASALDPSDDWWGYANAMESRKTHIMDAEHAERRMLEAQAKMKARQEQLAKLRATSHD